MEKENLLFYNEYEEFYEMAEKSTAFQTFCHDAFGQDFSQDGFSDTAQIDMILPYISTKEDVHILDIGCGNGKMLGYLQRQGHLFMALITPEKQLQMQGRYLRKEQIFRRVSSVRRIIQVILLISSYLWIPCTLQRI